MADEQRNLGGDAQQLVLRLASTTVHTAVDAVRTWTDGLDERLSEARNPVDLLNAFVSSVARGAEAAIELVVGRVAPREPADAHRSLQIDVVAGQHAREDLALYNLGPETVAEVELEATDLVPEFDLPAARAARQARKVPVLHLAQSGPGASSGAAAGAGTAAGPAAPAAAAPGATTLEAVGPARPGIVHLTVTAAVDVPAGSYRGFVQVVGTDVWLTVRVDVSPSRLEHFASARS